MSCFKNNDQESTAKQASAGFFRKALSGWLGEESGALGAVEFTLLATIIVIGLIVGLTEYRNALATEYGDAAAAISSVNQSYTVDWNGDGDTDDPGEVFTDTIPASVALDGNGIAVDVAVTGE